MIFSHLYPDLRKKSIYDIDFQNLYDRGYRGLILDIDNTLVPHNADADDRIENLFLRLAEIGFKTCLFSNNKEDRVKRFNRNIKSLYIFNAGKPRRKNYRKSMKLMGTKRRETLAIGDQVFTDVWGARRSGIKCILLEPINEKEEIRIVLKRYIEKLFLYVYERLFINKLRDV